MSVRTFILTHPGTFPDFKAKVLEAQRNESLLEISGKETDLQPKSPDGIGKMRNFKILITLIQPIVGDYTLLGQDQATEPCDWVSINIDTESGQIIVTVVG